MINQVMYIFPPVWVMALKYIDHVEMTDCVLRYADHHMASTGINAEHGSRKYLRKV